MRHSAQEIQYLTTSTRLEKLKGKGGLQVSFEIYSIPCPGPLTLPWSMDYMPIAWI